MKATLLLLLLGPCLYSQSLQWAKSFNPAQAFGSNVEGISIKTDAAGNTYVAGNFTGAADFDPSAGTANLISASTAFSDVFIAKYNPSGSLVFAKSIGSTNAEVLTSLAVDANGNIAVCGYFLGAVDFDPDAAAVHSLTSAGRNDAFFARYDAAGNYVFAKSIGGSLNDSATSIAMDASGNLYLTGLYNGPADFDPGPGVQSFSGSSDIFFAKYDAAGNYVYAKPISGGGTEQGECIAVDAAGNVYLTGFFSGSADFDPGTGVQTLYPSGFDAFFAKYDASGNYVFAKQVGGSGADQGLGLSIDGAANIFVTGYFNSTVDFDPGAGTQNLTASVTNNFFLAKYDATGNYVYAQRGFGTGLAVDASGNAFVTGSFSGTQDFDPGAGVQSLSSTGGTDAFIAKYNATGGYVYAKAVGGAANDGGNAIALSATGEVYFTGFFVNSADMDPGAGVQTITGSASAVNNSYVAKYDAAGDYVWAGNMGGYLNTVYSSGAYGIAKDAAGNLYITGTFQGTVDFDSGPATQNLSVAAPTAGKGDVFLAKYDATGNFLFAKSLTGTATAISLSLVVDAGGNVCMTGYFRGTVDFDPGPSTVNLTSTSISGDLFIAKYDAAGGYVYAKQFGNNNNNISRCITADASGNIYITGDYSGSIDFDPGAGVQTLTSVGGPNVFLAKYDASGGYVYAKSISISSNAYAQGIASDGAGNVYLTGAFSGTGDFDPGPGTQSLTSTGYDVYLAKYDASGGYVFAKKIGGSMQDQGNAIAIDAAGNSYITGYFSGTADFDPGPSVQNLTAGYYDGFVAKYDAAGNYLFARNFGGGSSVLEPHGIALDENGNVLVTGRFGINVDFNLGSTPVNRTSQDDDIFLSKYSTAGTLLGVATAGGVGGDISRAVIAGAAGKVYITGYFNNVADFDPTAGVQNLTTLNGNTIFLAGYNLPNAGGALPLRLTSFTVQNKDCSNTLSWTSENETAFNRFELEQSTENVMFGLAATVPAKGASASYKTTLPTAGKTGYYRLKMIDNNGRFQYSSTVNISSNCRTGFGFMLSPNPAVNKVTLQWYNAEPDARIAITVLDAAGRVVLTQTKNASAYANSGLDVSALQQGVYWIKAVDTKNNATYQTSFVKQ